MNKTTTEMRLVSIDKLIPYINNARTHSPEQINKLRASLREFGFVNPVIIDREYNVIAGHGRISAAKDEGYKEVPCVFVDEMTEAQKKASSGRSIIFPNIGVYGDGLSRSLILVASSVTASTFYLLTLFF